jgi:hypothetical protein
MLNPNRHDEEITWSERHVAVRQPNRQAALEDQEEVIGVVVMMPDEVTLTFTTITSCPLNWATVRGDQCSWNSVSFCSRLTTCEGRGDDTAPA